MAVTTANMAASQQSDESSSDGSSSTPLASREPSVTDLKSLGTETKPAKKLSLKERGKIPSSFYLSVTIIITAHFIGGIWSLETLKNWSKAMTSSGSTAYDTMVYLRGLMQAAFTGEMDNWQNFLYVCVITALVGSLVYVLLIAPFMAGFWTGRRSRRHKIHRYMGLLYLFQYAAAWIQYLTDYENAKDSYISHFIAINGIIQGYSAFFSFKVLPELDDAGYYSDKAVASRNFIHENIFFTMMAVFGSVYYNQAWREKLRSTLPGLVIEYMFIFFPYIVVRPFFPITRFSKAGTTKNGRSKRNEAFYRVGTKMVKFFYLWAKYFLGFYVNFLVFLDLMTPNQMKFLHGMFLLNLGTVSISIFLHTLRFKKVLPGKLTFSIYLLQIYATFSAIPMAYDMFISHKLLCGLCAAGILCNMTRSRPIHGVWCVAALYLLKVRNDIDW